MIRLRYVLLSFVWGLCAVGCRRSAVPGQADLPALSTAPTNAFLDVAPRWSHDGKRIAFLRETLDRKHQLFIADARLEDPRPLLPPEVIAPDRRLATSLLRYAAPDTLAFSPEDRQIAFPRADWMQTEKGERFPGMALWAYEFATQKTVPIALHPPLYQGKYPYYRRPQWSPDGKRIAFTGEGPQGHRGVFWRLLERQRPTEANPFYDRNEDSDWAAWEPRQAAREVPTLTFRQGWRRAISLPFTETLRRVRPGDPSAKDTGVFWRMIPQEIAARQPNPAQPVHPRTGNLVWSPDGLHLAFTLTPDPLDFDRYEIWVIDRNGKNAKPVGASSHKGRFAPVWIGNDRIGGLEKQSAGVYHLLSWDLKQSRQTLHGVLPTADMDWSPDRRTVVYATPLRSKSSAEISTLRLLKTGL